MKEGGKHVKDIKQKTHSECVHTDAPGGSKITQPAHTNTSNFCFQGQTS